MTQPLPDNPDQMTPLGALLKRTPDWDRAVIPDVQREFLGWLKLMRVPAVSVTRLTDSEPGLSRYALVQPTPVVGRYQVTLLFQESPGTWMIGNPRPNMDIRAALTEVARLVAESA
jgi:hypothetical protein